MTLPELSIRRPVFVSCLFLVILALGLLARFKLQTSLYPDVTFPVINVIVRYPAAGANEVERQVSKPLETALNSLTGIREIRSMSIDGASIVTAAFTMDTDLRFAEQKVIQTVAQARSELPKGAGEPEVRSVDPSDVPVATFSLSASLPEASLFDLADREIRPRLEQVPGVGEVEVLGARKREVDVELDAARLLAHEMSAAEVSGRLGAAGVNVPSGELDERGREIYVRTTGEFDSLAAIRKTPIRFVGNEKATTVEDVATVREGLEAEKNRVYINGQRALVLRVFRRSGGNTVAVSDRIQEKTRELERSLGSKVPGFRLQLLRDGARSVREGIQDATEAILLGVVLTVLVVLLFLGNLRSTIITALALPNSLLGAFLMMWVAGFSVNITTLAALALGVGLLIDDAIVVRENIFRRMGEGEAPAWAAVRGTQEVTLAVIATTLTVLSVFGPVSFLGGVIGQFFKEFGMTICFAMLISLLDSLTIAPMLSAYFAGKTRSETGAEAGGKGIIGIAHRVVDRFHDSQLRAYLALLRRTLEHPLAVLAFALGVFGLSFLALAAIPKSFVPSQESGEFQVQLDLPAGVSLETMDAAAREADRRIRAIPGVERSLLTVGGSIGQKNHAEILVLLEPQRQRKLSTGKIKDIVRKDMAGLRDGLTSRVEDLMDIGGGAGRPFSLLLTGEDMDQLKAASAEVVRRLQGDPDLQDVDRSYRAGAQELRWVIDPDLARSYGISSGEVGQELRLLLTGDTPARLHENGRDYDVRVRLDPAELDVRDGRGAASAFAKVLVPNLNHRMIPLRLVARPVEAETPAGIQRRDRKRFIEITADVNPRGRGMAAALDWTRHALESGRIRLPPGVQYEFAGQTRDFQDLLNSVILAGILAVGAMYLVLASLYDSFFVPLSIMLVLPLAVCGAFYALWITRSGLDIYSMIGCVLLMGVAAKNSILLVDHIQRGVHSGKPLREAILEGGRDRLRPIMMTSFALIAGMLPMALPFQEAARQRAPMAIAVIGGVISSTLLTLVVVPAAFGFILRLQGWVLARLRGILNPARLD